MKSFFYHQLLKEMKWPKHEVQNKILEEVLILKQVGRSFIKSSQ